MPASHIGPIKWVTASLTELNKNILQKFRVKSNFSIDQIDFWG